MILTDHAEQRMIKRCGYKRSSVNKTAEKALEHGLRHSELSGHLKRFVDSLYLSQQNANNIRIYNQHAYLFKGSILITVIPLTKKQHKMYLSIKEKVRGE